MELEGKIVELNDNYGYILCNNKYYLFTKFDLLEDVKLNDIILFKEINDLILKAFLISKK